MNHYGILHLLLVFQVANRFHFSLMLQFHLLMESLLYLHHYLLMVLLSHFHFAIVKSLELLVFLLLQLHVQLLGFLLFLGYQLVEALQYIHLLLDFLVNQ